LFVGLVATDKTKARETALFYAFYLGNLPIAARLG
jgi:hypothetical protein